VTSRAPVAQIAFRYFGGRSVAADARPPTCRAWPDGNASSAFPESGTPRCCVIYELRAKGFQTTTCSRTSPASSCWLPRKPATAFARLQPSNCRSLAFRKRPRFGPGDSLSNFCKYEGHHQAWRSVCPVDLALLLRTGSHSGGPTAEHHSELAGDDRSAQASEPIWLLGPRTRETSPAKDKKAPTPK
jgi:hypothetical protein